MFGQGDLSHNFGVTGLEANSALGQFKYSKGLGTNGQDQAQHNQSLKSKHLTLDFALIFLIKWIDYQEPFKIRQKFQTRILVKSNSLPIFKLNKLFSSKKWERKVMGKWLGSDIRLGSSVIFCCFSKISNWGNLWKTVVVDGDEMVFSISLSTSAREERLIEEKVVDGSKLVVQTGKLQFGKLEVDFQCRVPLVTEVRYLI